MEDAPYAVFALRLSAGNTTKTGSDPSAKFLGKIWDYLNEAIIGFG